MSLMPLISYNCNSTGLTLKFPLVVSSVHVPSDLLYWDIFPTLMANLTHFSLILHFNASKQCAMAILSQK